MPISQAKKNSVTPEKQEGDQSRRRTCFEERASDSEAPAAKTSAENRIGRTPWQVIGRLFGRLLKKDRSQSKTVEEARNPQQRVAFPDVPTTATAPQPEKKKQKSFWRLFNCCRRRHRVAPDPDEKKHHSSSTPLCMFRLPCFRPDEPQTKTQQPDSSVQVDPELKLKGGCATKDKANKKDKKAAATVPQQPVLAPSIKDANVSDAYQRQAINSAQTLSVQQVSSLGFPNLSQSCYMNSCLQSLITLREFVRDVSCQEEVWSLIPEAKLISLFMDIVRCRGTRDARYKLRTLKNFKKVLSVRAPEFAGNRQNDAHEFLITILDQMRSLAAPLQEIAAFVGTSYSCPVERNLKFTMQNTRTCKSCGAQSIRVEDFTHLSLDLIPGGSVQQMLEEYQMETLLEYKCECGSNTSGQRSSFLTLPRFLILHLKRFRVNQYLEMMKLHDPVVLFKELMVSSSSQALGWYSLVSDISHLGSGRDNGHYISNGLDPDEDLDASNDRWLRYDDYFVTKTTGATVCEKHQKTAYILFYQRRM